MHRIFVPPNRISASAITVDDPRQVHHLCHVLRVQVGDALLCADGQGHEYAGVVARRTAAALTIRIERARPAPAGSLTLWLVQGLPKGDRLEWIVQKDDQKQRIRELEEKQRGVYGNGEKKK